MVTEDSQIPEESQSPSPGFDWRNCCKEKSFWVLLALVILYFYRLVFLGETLFYRDLYLIHFPQKKLLVDLVTHGQLPLWDPYLHGGQPYLAEPTNNAIYPSNLLYFVLPLVTAFNLDIVLHLLIAAVGCYFLGRALRMRTHSSFLLGVLFCFSGFTLSLVNHFVRHLAFCLLPAMVLFWHLYLSERRKRWFLWAVAFATMQLLTGSIEILLISLFLLFVWSFSFSYPRVAPFARLRKFFLMILFVAGLGLIQILPTLEMLKQSSRGAMNYSSFALWSIHPKRLPEIVVPHFMGKTDTLSGSDYWGDEIEDQKFPYILSIYLGVIAVACATRGAFLRNKAAFFTRRAGLTFFSLAMIAMILSLGRFTPLLPLIHSLLPFLGFVRYPEKLFAMAILPVALLAAFAFDVEFQSGNAADRKILIGMWILSTILLGWNLLFKAFTSGFCSYFFNHVTDTMASGLNSSFFHVFVIWLLATLVYQFRRFKIHWIQQPLVLVIVVLDLFLASAGLNPTAPREFFTSTPRLAQVVKDKIDGSRFFRADNSTKNVTLQAPSNDVLWQYRWNLEVLNFYTAHLYNIRTIYHTDFDRLASVAIVELGNIVHSLPPERALNLLHAGAVDSLLTSESLDPLKFRLLATVQNQSNVPFRFYEVLGNSGRAWFVSKAIVAKSKRETIQTMLSADFDVEKEVVLQTSTFHNLNSECSGQVATIEDRTTFLSYTVQNSCDGYLVFSEPYYPGWNVEIDHVKAPVLRANSAFSAVAVTAGKHLVARSYRPVSVMIGLCASILFAIGLLIAWNADWIK